MSYVCVIYFHDGSEKERKRVLFKNHESSAVFSQRRPNEKLKEKKKQHFSNWGVLVIHENLIFTRLHEFKSSENQKSVPVFTTV